MMPAGPPAPTARARPTVTVTPCRSRGILHQIWLGPNPLPEEFAAYGETWRRHHPAWDYRLWTEDTLPPDLARLEVYERLRFPAERADILRLELLWRDGGVYLQMGLRMPPSARPAARRR